MEIRPARPSERDEVLELLAHWFNTREFFARYNQNDPAFRDELCLVAQDRGRIVSTVQIFDRQVNLSGQAVPMAGIGSVYTMADYRKQGIASALMRLSLETMEREGFEVSLLFAERLKFYGAFGWRSVTRLFSALRDAEQIQSSGRLVIEPFDPALHMAQVAALYNSYSGRFNGTVVRSQDYWRGSLRYAGNPGEYFAVCRGPTGGPAAYTRAIRLYGFPMIMEYGYRPDAMEAIVALFRHLAGSAPSIPKSYRLESEFGGDLLHEDRAATEPLVPVSHTAHDPKLEEHLITAGCSVVHHQDNFFMWRVISPERLARRFDIPPAAAAERVLQMVGDSGSLYWTADRF